MSKNPIAVIIALSLLGAAAPGGGAPACAADETIRIAMPANLTGELSSLDIPTVNGAKLKARQLNQSGGVLGKMLELVVVDTGTAAATIAAEGSRLIAQRPAAIVAYTDSDSVLTLGPLAQQAGIPFVTPGATSPQLPTQIGDGLFLACFGDNVQAAAGAEFLRNNLAAKTAAFSNLTVKIGTVPGTSTKLAVFLYQESPDSSSSLFQVTSVTRA